MDIAKSVCFKTRPKPGVFGVPLAHKGLQGRAGRAGGVTEWRCRRTPKEACRRPLDLGVVSATLCLLQLFPVPWDKTVTPEKRPLKTAEVLGGARVLRFSARSGRGDGMVERWNGGVSNFALEWDAHSVWTRPQPERLSAETRPADRCESPLRAESPLFQVAGVPEAPGSCVPWSKCPRQSNRLQSPKTEPTQVGGE